MFVRLLFHRPNSLISSRIFHGKQSNCFKDVLQSKANNMERCFTCSVLQRHLYSTTHSVVNLNTWKRDNEELKAWGRLFRRSGFHVKHDGPSRSFSTSNSQRQQDNGKNNKEDDDDKNGKTPPLSFVFLMIYPLISLWLWSKFSSNSNMSLTVTWLEFVNELLKKGEVEEILVYQFSPEVHKIRVRLYPGAEFKNVKGIRTVMLSIPDSDQFEAKLRMAEESIGIKSDQGVPVIYRRVSKFPVSTLFLLLLVAGVLMAGRGKLSGSASDMFSFYTQAKYSRADVLATGKKGISFKDVAGLHEAKGEIMEFVDYLKYPERFKALGAKVPKGALLTGPPGCGKTLLAKALATEAQVPFLVMAGSEFVEIIGGVGASRVRSLFKDARAKAPCIIYVDEIDAIGEKRMGNNVEGGNSEKEQTLNQLLVELDGMGTMDGVVMLASTNRAEVLDKALLRPGRFDRHINIDLPTLAERKEIFEIYLKKLKLGQPPTDFSERLSQLSPGMSGADIANICNEAALFAARNSKKVVENVDFDYAVERIVAGAAKKSRVLSLREKKVIAYHEAGHALVGWLLQHTDLLLRVSIVQRTNATLGFAQYSPKDKHLHSKDELFEKMCMILGGRVAESLIFNNVTSGAQDDLKKVTRMAYLQIKSLGMSDVLGTLSFPSEAEGDFVKKPYSKRLANQIDQEANSLVAKAYKVTEKLLLENKEKLRVIADALLEKEVLTYKDMEQLIGPPPFDKQAHLIDWTPPQPTATA